MSRPSAVLSRNASDLLEVRDLGQVDASFADDFRDDTVSRAPLRMAMQRTSDFAFIADLVASTAEQLASIAGPDSWTEMAIALVAVVLGDPAVSMQHATKDEIRVLQAVTARASHDANMPFDLCLRLTAAITPQGFAGKQRVPPTVTAANIELTLCDIREPSEGLQLVKNLIAWQADFPESVEPFRRGQGTVALLGDPSRLCADGAPADWRLQLTSLVTAFGRNVTIIGDGSKFSGDLPADTVLAALFDPYAGHDPRLPDGVEATLVPTREMTFAALGARLCDLLAAIDDSDDALPPLEQVSGRTVFHRKVGSSRHFDKFDAGSDAPCQHGAGSFTPWSGDKCVKGFERRYADFEPSMLRHCRKFPNCNVYAVFG